MKKIILTTILTTILAVSTYAQNTKPQVTSGNVNTQNSTYKVQGSFGDPMLTKTGTDAITVWSGFWTTVFPGQDGWGIPQDPISPITDALGVGDIKFGRGFVILTNKSKASLPYSITVYDVKGSLLATIANGVIASDVAIEKSVALEEIPNSGALLYRVSIGAHSKSRVFNLTR